MLAETALKLRCTDAKLKLNFLMINEILDSISISILRELVYTISTLHSIFD